MREANAQMRSTLVSFYSCPDSLFIAFPRDFFWEGDGLPVAYNEHTFGRRPKVQVDPQVVPMVGSNLCLVGLKDLFPGE